MNVIVGILKIAFFVSMLALLILFASGVFSFIFRIVDTILSWYIEKHLKNGRLKTAKTTLYDRNCERINATITFDSGYFIVEDKKRHFIGFGKTVKEAENKLLEYLEE